MSRRRRITSFCCIDCRSAGDNGRRARIAGFRFANENPAITNHRVLLGRVLPGIGSDRGLRCEDAPECDDDGPGPKHAAHSTRDRDADIRWDLVRIACIDTQGGYRLKKGTDAVEKAFLFAIGQSGAMKIGSVGLDALEYGEPQIGIDEFALAQVSSG